MSFVSLAWTGYARLEDFKAYHSSIAQEVTSSTRDSIQRYITERRRMVSIFANTNRDIIKELIHNPASDEIFEEISNRLRVFFPYHFTFTVADENGIPFYEDFDGLIGDQCKADLKLFSKTNEHLPRLHPNPELYHFDIMVPFNYEANNRTLFVSFDADLLGEILQNAHVPEHHLMLVLPVSERKVIEITESGARIHIADRLDYRLEQHELERILFERKIEETAWNIVDFRSADLYTNFIYKLAIELSIIFTLIFMAMSLMLLYLKREQALKQKAEQNKTDFLSVVSHELRTPLTSIKGAIGLIANGVTGDLNPKTLELAKVALGNSDRLINIVNDLLDVQKLESGKLTLNMTVCNLSEQVNLAMQSTAGYGQQFNVNYKLLDLQPNTKVYIDKNQFQQVMNNLLSNATKYGGRDKTVDISIISHLNNIRISVTDYGNGIPDEFRSTIFDKYSQLEKNSSKDVKSTGLGLSIVKQIVELHKGKIDFHSDSQGTTFFIDLPVYAANSTI